MNNFLLTIKLVLKEKKIKIKQLSEMTGISVPYIYQILRGDASGNLKVIDKICEALEIEIEVKFVEKESNL